ncbi:MAG TPA: MASE1 domain-containing protein [Burkholderiales bacterium]|nr:MASE1 domain-containing protein [Burkholderiales bacterium]
MDIFINYRAILAALSVGLAYYAGAFVGFDLTFQSDPVSTFWPSNAILMAALILAPIRKWWIFLLAVFPAHLTVQFQSGIPSSMIAAWFISNTSEALLGATLIKHFVADPLRFDSFRHAILFLFYGAFTAPLLSSFLDTAFVQWNAWSERPYWEIWRMRFFSNVLAVLTLVPVIVSWSGQRLTSLPPVPWTRYLEAGALALGLLSVSLFLFVGVDAESNAAPVLLYAPVPFLLWAAIRFGPVGSSTAVLFIAIFALWTTVHGQGPFVLSSPVASARSIQLFLTALSVLLLLLAVVIEDERQARKALHRNGEQLRLALSAARIDTWDWHIARNIVTWGNPSMRIFDIVGNARAGFNLSSDTLHPQDRTDVLRSIHRALNERTGFEKTFRILDEQGSVKWVMAKAEVLYDRNNRPARMIGVTLNVTEQKRIEFEMEQQRRQLTYLMRVATLGELSGALAHELNQPLTAILINAQVGQKLLAKTPIDLEEMRAIFDDIVHDDQRAAEVIRRLRVLFQKSDPQFRALDVNDLVREVLDLATTDFVTRHVDAQIDLAGELPKISGDRVQLQQVLLNLIINACEAMNATPHEKRLLLICTRRSDSRIVRISITDHGPGFSKHRSEQLFDAFYTTKEQGLGFGLSISRSIVTAHQGRLWAENNEPLGATFHVDFPEVGAKLA